MGEESGWEEASWMEPRGEMDPAVAEAIECDDVAGLRRIVAAGGSLRGAHRKKWPAMAYAARCGVARVARELLRLGLSVHEPGAAGNAPIQFCVDEDDPDLLRVLLDAGADPNSLNHSKSAPLMRACGMGHERAALMLLEAGADPNAFDKLGESPLICAMQSGSPALVAALIERGAEPTRAGPRGRSAADWARSTLSPASPLQPALEAREREAAEMVAGWEERELDQAAKAAGGSAACPRL